MVNIITQTKADNGFFLSIYNVAIIAKKMKKYININITDSII